MKDAELPASTAGRAVRVTGRWQPCLPHGAVSRVTTWEIPSDDLEAERLPEAGSAGLVYEASSLGEVDIKGKYKVTSLIMI